MDGCTGDEQATSISTPGALKARAQHPNGTSYPSLSVRGRARCRDRMSFRPLGCVPAAGSWGHNLKLSRHPVQTHTHSHRIYPSTTFFQRVSSCTGLNELKIEKLSVRSADSHPKIQVFHVGHTNSHSHSLPSTDTKKAILQEARGLLGPRPCTSSSSGQQQHEPHAAPAVPLQSTAAA